MRKLGGVAWQAGIVSRATHNRAAPRRVRHNSIVIDRRIILLLAVVGICVPLFGQQYSITTIAGQGVAGVSLSNPTSVAVDQAGDVYVADWSGIIRKIWAGYRTSTIAAGTGVRGYSGDGGQATNAT